MKIKTAKFIKSSPSLKSAPEFNEAEFALLGRSNAGKSTFINSITNNGKLAKTSNTPGKTRLINHFEIVSDKGKFIIADLPGYGWAKVSKAMQNEWQKNLEEYLLCRKNLKYCFQFSDARHGLLNNDIQMIDWLIKNKIPFINIMAKCDLVSQGDIIKRQREIENFTKTMCILFSNSKPLYKEKVFDFLECNI